MPDKITPKSVKKIIQNQIIIIMCLKASKLKYREPKQLQKVVNRAEASRPLRLA